MEPLYREIDLNGLAAFNQKYKSYSVDTYLNSINMSRAAINYISLMLNIETSLFAALTEIIQDRNILDQQFYHIIGGNDRLPNSLLAACLAVPNNRCSILYNTRVTGVTLRNGVLADITYISQNASFQNVTSQLYDHVIVATTAAAANIIDFNDRSDFVDSYRAMRQVHYDCASKVALFFAYQWWVNNPQVNIQGGHSTTDLPVRFVYYHNFNVSASLQDGAAMLASYTWSQDALQWQSIPDDVALQIALENMNRLHRQEVISYYIGGVTKHWCNDIYSHGAYALFTPFQEQDIKGILALSVKNVVHFIGEHTSSLHKWIEGATLSALRVMMEIQEESFDVAIIGGGPVGLLTAIQLARENTSMNIVIVEQFTIGNSYGSSHDNVRQFRQPHSEEYLAKLATISFGKWRELENGFNLPVNSLLNTTNGFLYFGNGQTSPDTVEGNLNKIDQNCIELKMNCEILNGTQLRDRFRFFSTSAIVDRGIFHRDSGYIDTARLLSVLRTTIETQYKNILIRENESFLDLDQTVLDRPNDYVRLRTNRGSLQAKRVVFVPGPYAKNISNTLGFDLNITMWELPTLYFRLNSPTYEAPTWFYSGENKQSLFNGYPIEATDRPGFMKISPEFIEFPNDVLIYPKDRQGSKIDFEYFIQQTSEWIARYATYVDPNVYEYDNTSTCLATFVPDNGFIIDRLPSNIKYNSKIVMYAAGWGMKFAPVFAEILTDFVLGTESTSPYAEYLPNFSLNIPGRIINPQTTIPPVITTTAASTPVIWKFLSIGLMAAIALVIVLVVVVLVYRRLVNRNAYLQT
jgi:glycine/D-amino acid oxidase-like deaminating enzyme